MLDNESIDEMLTCFTKIANELSSLGDSIDNDQKMRKIIRVLSKSWEVKATTLKELNDREEMDFSGFIENLKTHEIEMKVREEREPPKKKSIAFKATPSSIEEELSKDSDEDFVMLIRNVGKMFYKKGDKVTSEEKDHKKDSRRRRWVLLSLQEDRPSHCGLFFSTSYHLQESAQEEKSYGSHMGRFENRIQRRNRYCTCCFMANREETSKVNLEASLDEYDLTMDELAQVFEELQDQYEISIAQNKN